ncbi:putative membrane protein [Lachnospiraceae bacterium KM106-2]|nr:putative membrane protein [Lachnospiraceae bacterium KM106-2]
MTTQLNAILIGFSNFPFFAVMLTVPIILGTVLHYKCLNFVRIGINYTFLLYSLCLVAVVLLPLPSIEQAAKLSTYDIQVIPFHFVIDICKDPKAIAQFLLNIVMVVPFGMYLRYYFKMSRNTILLMAFLLSAAIEVTQLTGIYGIYSGSYRLCDVDDLIANTLGGFLGYSFILRMECALPKIQSFDILVSKFSLSHKLQQL